jgi:hypothetical protein
VAARALAAVTGAMLTARRGRRAGGASTAAMVVATPAMRADGARTGRAYRLAGAVRYRRPQPCVFLFPSRVTGGICARTTAGAHVVGRGVASRSR